MDAGHGGTDPGNIGNGYREKNIALNVVKEISEELRNTPDIKVVFTRNKDILINLWKRGEIANKAKANLFVSIHCDAHNSDAYGAGTFVLGLHANKRNFEVAKRENAVISLEENFKERYKGFDPNSEESVLGLTLMQEENLDKSFSLAADIQGNFTKSLKRKDQVAIFRLRTTHVQLNAHLSRITKDHPPACPLCGYREETVNHFLFDCPTLQDARTEFLPQNPNLENTLYSL